MTGVAVLVSIASLAVAGTWASWTATDTNPGNTFSTSTILLADNQGGAAGSSTATGTAMFPVTYLSPGSGSTSACIGVDFNTPNYTPSLTLTASLGGADATLLSQGANALTMNVATYNTTGTTNVTTGTNSNLGLCANYPSSGTNTTIGTQGATLATWAASSYPIASPVTHTWYKFTVSGLPAGASDCATYCNKTITVTLNWTLNAA